MLLPKVSMKNNTTKIILCLAALGGLIGLAMAAGATASTGVVQGRASVIDGDTLEVRGAFACLALMPPNPHKPA